MFGFRVLRASRPEHRWPVIELEVDNALGRWLYRKGWGGFTLPLLRFAVIFYWLLPHDEVSPYVRVHEWHHITQWEAGQFYRRYCKAALRGYADNELEREAYAVQHRAHIDGLPPWA